MTRLLATRRPDGLLVPRAIRGADGLVRPAGEGCGGRCCNCWRAADTCPPLVPLPPECLAETLTIYVSCAVRCEGAPETDPPLGPGDVFLFEGRCYTIREETIPFEEIPDGATLLDKTAVVECVPAGCLDARCNQAGLWVTGEPCSPEAAAGQVAPSMPACAMTHCLVLNIGGVCWRFDPANAQVQIPLRPIAGATQGFADCCECHDGVLDCHRLRSGVICGEYEYICCCDFDDDRYEVTFSASGSSLLRLTWAGPDFYGGSGQNFQEGRSTYTEGLNPAPGDPGRTLLRRTTSGVTRYPDGRPASTDTDESESEGHVPAGECPPKPTGRPDRGFGEWGFEIAGISVGTLCAAMAAGGSITYVDGTRRTTITGSVHGDCMGATIAFSATVIDDNGETGPNSLHRYQEIHDSARWVLRRIPAAGPCANGCGGGGGVGTKPGNRVRPDRIVNGGDLGSGLGGFL